ncbi:hypothetical protein O5D80_003319 [Batrachochytrium dendrobatidis]|nr:hypothetical protein O5D80_003319 [Batrachochytrium dendrobatidis]
MIMNLGLLTTLFISTVVCSAITPLSSDTDQQDEFSILSKRDGLAVDSEVVEQIQTYVQYSAASYCPSVITHMGWICGSACSGRTADTKIVKVFDNFFIGTGVAGFIAYNERTETIVVTFRGSVSATDWTNNLDFFLNDASFGEMVPAEFGGDDVQIHSGFMNLYKGSKDKIAFTLKTLSARFPAYKIVFAGHSLGGAMAALCAVDYHFLNPEVADKLSVYSIGAPRIGNLAWANLVGSLPFSSRIYRVTATKDLVVDIPKNTPLLNYVHHSQQYNVQNGVTVKCINSGVGGETVGCNYPNYGVPGLFAHGFGYYGWSTLFRIC